MSRETLDELARKYGTDKSSKHNYCPIYEERIGHLRDQPCKILELGVLGGQSLLMWYDYFPQARIVGLDQKLIFAPDPVHQDRIAVVQGDQADTGVLRYMQLKYGPFDLIIDDASHIWDKTIISFETLFPDMNSPGIYVIEDLESSYEPHITVYPQYKSGRISTVDYLKSCVDAVYHSSDGIIKSLHFHRNICFLVK